MDRPRHILIIASLALGLLNTGCKKETPFDGSAGNSVSSTESEQGRSFANTDPTGMGSLELAALRPGAVLFSLSEEEQKAQDEAARARLSQQSDARGGGTGRPAGCPILIESTSSLRTATLVSGSFCDNTAQVSVVYDWYTLETFAYQGSIAFAFEVQAGLLSTYTGSYTLLGSGSQPGCNNDMGYGECPVLKHFEVTVIMSGTDYGGSWTANKVTGTSSCLANPTVFSHGCSLDYPNAYYTGNPARVTVTGSSGFAVLLTDCSILCPPPHTVCPTSGTFQYQRVSPPPAGPLTTVTISGSGQLITLAPGDYTYTCTLHYSFGNSQPYSDSFTVN